MTPRNWPKSDEVKNLYAELKQDMSANDGNISDAGAATFTAFVQDSGDRLVAGLNALAQAERDTERERGKGGKK